MQNETKLSKFLNGEDVPGHPQGKLCEERDATRNFIFINKKWCYFYFSVYIKYVNIINICIYCLYQLENNILKVVMALIT